MIKTIRVLIIVSVVSVCLFGFTRLSHAIDDSELNMAAINFVEFINKENYDEALSLTLGNNSQQLVETKKIFGTIEISDFATSEEAKAFQQQCPVTSDNCIAAQIDSDYFENKSNGVVKVFYKVNFEFGGKGLVEIYFPGDESAGQATDSKIAAVTFFIMREGNFMGFSKAMNNLNVYAKTLETK